MLQSIKRKAWIHHNILPWFLKYWENKVIPHIQRNSLPSQSQWLHACTLIGSLLSTAVETLNCPSHKIAVAEQHKNDRLSATPSLNQDPETAKDRQGWCAAVHGIAESWTWLSSWTRAENHWHKPVIDIYLPSKLLFREKHATHFFLTRHEGVPAGSPFRKDVCSSEDRERVGFFVLACKPSCVRMWGLEFLQLPLNDEESSQPIKNGREKKKRKIPGIL